MTTFAERLKALSYRGDFCGSWFWRTIQQQEIDYVEEKNGRISAYEFKWSANAKAKVSKTFLASYPGSAVSVVSQDNYDEFLLDNQG